MKTKHDATRHLSNYCAGLVKQKITNRIELFDLVSLECCDLSKKGIITSIIISWNRKNSSEIFVQFQLPNDTQQYLFGYGFECLMKPVHAKKDYMKAYDRAMRGI
jgi:hypothetical protein